jgi:hypothetical protein
MRKLVIIGMAATLAGCGGHDATQIVHKDRSTVYAAFSDAMKESAGQTTSDGFSFDVKETPNDTIDVKLMHHGGIVTHAVFNFTKQNGDKDTLVTADIDVDREVAAEAFGRSPQGGAVAKVVSEAAVNIGFKNMLKKSAERIESGMPINIAHATFSSGPGSDTSSYASSYEARRQQEAATRPMSDPDEAAQQYMSQGSSGSSSYSGSYSGN